MLASPGVQYLQPDCITSSSMDAKQSPLALLALTCNSIGKDVNSKPSPPIQTAEKKDTAPKDSKDIVGKSMSKSKDNTRPDSRERTSDACKSNNNLSKISTKSASPAKTSREGHHHTSTRPSVRDRSRSPIDRRLSESPVIGSSRSTSSANQKRVNSGRDSSDHNSSSSAKTSSKANDDCCTRKNANISPPYPSRPRSSHQRAASPFSSAAAAAALASGLRGAAEHAGALGGAAAGLSPFGYYPFGGHQLALDAAALYAASLAGRYSPSKAVAPPAHHHSSLAGGASPFVSYATVKTASGSSTLVPVCKDPYCSQCQVALRAAQLMPPSSPTSCPPGCTQCTEKMFALAASAGGYSSSYPSSMFHGHAFSPLGSSGHHSGSSSGASSGAHPFICSWVMGGEYCGKKFTTSDELLSHLRTHTVSSSDALAHHSSVAPASLGGFPSLPLGLMSSYAQLQSAYSALGGQDSLRQSAYPRSLSPSSLLSANRFNPYKLPSLLPPSVSTAGMLGGGSLPPSLSSLYAPYLYLYGQRLGVIP